MQNLWMQRSFFIKAAVLTPLALLLTTSLAWAHKVNVYAYAEGETVHVRGYFSKNPAKNCTVIVSAPDGTQLVTGKTDEKGEFDFKAPVRADLTIKIFAGEGHINFYVLKAEELPESLPDFIKEKGVTPNIPEEGVQKESEDKNTDKSEIQVSLQELEKVVDKVVERKLAPLRKMLLEQQERSQGASFEKVLAGLGIILGLMGLTMFLHSIWHKKKQ